MAQKTLGSEVSRTHATEDWSTLPSSCWCGNHR